MKVLIVSNGIPPRGQWGTEFYTRELALGLAARGHELAVLVPDRGGARPRFSLEEDSVGGVPVYLVHNAPERMEGFEASYASAEVERVFAELVARLRPDVVHFTYLLWGLSARLPAVARDAGVPVVVTLTDYGLLCHRGQMFDHRLARCGGPHPPAVCARCIREPSRFDGSALAVLAKRAAVRAAALAGGLGKVVTQADVERRESVVRDALAASARLIAPTRVVASAFRRFGVPETALVVLPYAFDEAPWRAARPAPAGDAHVFAFLGQFSPHKGLATLLEAVEIMEHRLPESVEPWELWLYGGPAGGRHRRFAPALFARDRGPRVRVFAPFGPEDAPRVLAQIATVVVPSTWDENAPLTVLQARAAGIPVVASDVAGIAEVLERGVHGELVPPGDARALADALRTALLSRRRRTAAPGLPMTLAEHLDRIEAVHEAARASARPARSAR